MAASPDIVGFPTKRLFTPAAPSAIAPADPAALTCRRKTRQVLIGGLPIGGGAPVAVQSMLTAHTDDPAAALIQISELATAGCELIRVAIPAKSALDGFGQICEESPLPVIADIHFDFRLALAAVRLGAAKLRINPGNIGDLDMVDAIIDAAGAAGIPIRIGVNAGSLDAEIAALADLSLAEKLAASAERFVEHFEQRGFTDIVVSAKAHDVTSTVAAYRLLSRDIPHIPLHLGITETGTFLQGTVKSAAGIGALLLDGIGDTLRVSLTADPVKEVKVAWELLAACGLRRRHPELISCPTCGRAEVDLLAIAEAVERRLADIELPITVAVMGCMVNGPGEARDADVGVACGRGKGAIFAQGKVLYTVAEDQIISALFEEIERFSAR
jgi:(E)-4-hydroxy-3-methylbut-2-enyl-diphosphate synthase